MGKIALLHASEGEPVTSVLGGQSPHDLKASPNTLIRKVRSKLRALPLINTPEPHIGLFYNGYGLELGIGQSFQTVIAYLHTDYPNLRHWATGIAPHIDGIITVNEALADKLRSFSLTELEDRIRTVPYPVVTPPGLASVRSPGDRPLVLGYAGRMEFSQKRLERMLPVIRGLEASGLDYRFEFLGEGGDLRELKNLLREFPRVQFLGHREGLAYWECLQQWRHIVFTSDFEGLPIALLEAVSRGVVPIFPHSCMGSGWVDGLQAGLTYGIQDPSEVAEVVKRVQTWRSSDWNAFAEAAHLHTQAHSLQGYLRAFRSAVEDLAALPRLKRGRKTRYPGLLPVWVYHRIHSRRLSC